METPKEAYSAVEHGTKPVTDCRYFKYGKRGADLFLSLILLALLWLPMTLVAGLVIWDSPGGALFRQVRVGRNGKEFVCLKFRTMYRDTPRDCPSAQLSDAAKHLTGVGRLLRRTSLDELPQLINVLRGDMSLVGPRPLIPAEDEVHRMRLACGVYACRPGMSGLAQISGRNRLSDQEKVACDRYYTEHVSLGMDVKILWYTVRRVISGDGVDAPKE